MPEMTHRRPQEVGPDVVVVVGKVEGVGVGDLVDGDDVLHAGQESVHVEYQHHVQWRRRAGVTVAQEAGINVYDN